MQKREQGERRTKQVTVRSDLGEATTLGRRSFLRGALVGVAGVVTGVQLSGCSGASQRRVSDEPTQPPTPATQSTAQAISTGRKVCWPTSRGLAKTTITADELASRSETPKYWRA